MDELNLHCEPVVTQKIVVIDATRGVEIDDINMPDKAQGYSHSLHTTPLTTKLTLSNYMVGLMEAVCASIIEKSHTDLARHVLPLIASNVPGRLDAAKREAVAARENLQSTIELSDPARAKQLANARDEMDSIVNEWRAKMQMNVDALCNVITTAFSQSNFIRSATDASRKELTEEAHKLRGVAGGLEMGALKKVWSQRIQSIVDEELQLILDKIADHDKRKLEDVMLHLKDTPLAVQEIQLTYGEPLIDRCQMCACHENVLHSIDSLRTTLLRYADQIAM